MFGILCIEPFPYLLQVLDIEDLDIWDLDISNFVYLNYIF